MTALLEAEFDIDEAMFDDLDWAATTTDDAAKAGRTGLDCSTNMGCQSSIVPSSCGNTGPWFAMCVPCLP